MTKLIIQIPCYNEADTLAKTLKDLPRDIPGIAKVEWLVIDDGCLDNTVSVAIENGVDHIVRHSRNLGLARAFTTGLEASINLGADIIVNTDADNQYNALDIPELIAPIINGKADMVIGERPIATTLHFSIIKKMLQRLGSYIVRIVSRTSIPDAPSGFRALSRSAAMQIHIFNTHTYTLESIIQARYKSLSIVSVPVRTNKYLRPSRLITSTFGYIIRSMSTILRIFVIYQPLVFFFIFGSSFLFFGVLLGGRFLFFYALGEGQGHVQSLILMAVLLGAGGILVILGLISDLISINRRLLEKIDLKLYKLLESNNKND